MTEPIVQTIPRGKIRLTYRDYLELPNDGKRYEIIEGDVFVTPSPTTRHQRVSKRLEMALYESLEEAGHGEVFHAPLDVLLDEANVIQPDIVFVRNENLRIVRDENIQGIPDLIIEILSPSTRRSDLLIKSALYARFGVPCYWIADPDQNQIERFKLAERGAYRSQGASLAPDLLEPPEFPGLVLRLDEVFA